MKKVALLLTAVALFLLIGCQPKTESNAAQLAEKFADLKANFSDPHATFRSAPLWVWNGKVTKEFIDRDLTDLKEHGFGGVFVHPRPGLITEYLSDEWFELFQYTVEKGKKLGMDIWIYDENSYPSGFGGGHVPDRMPESYNQGSFLREIALTNIEEGDAEKYLAIFEKKGSGYNNIITNVADYIGKAGNYLAYEKFAFYTGNSWNAGFSYVDLLVPGVTDFFLKITIEDGYKKLSGNEFGKTIKGSFTDEPNIAPEGAGSLRWTPDLFARFSERYGYNLEDHLPSLKSNVGDYKKIRHNYYQLLLQLFIDRWSKPSFEYYQANNLEFTGHYWEHGWPTPHHGGDNMAMYAWHQRPAIDLLFNTMETEKPPTQFGDVRNVKELSSVANQMGCRRTLCETYGAAGWEFTFNEMKRYGDWQYALGVNTMNQHLTFQTLLGSRKHDHPQSFSYHAPYWDQYTPLNDYYGRLSYVLTAGQQLNDIVIFEPTTTAWMYYRANGEGEKRSNKVLKNLDASFRELLNGFEAKQIEYDLASENIVKDQGSVNGTEFIIGKRAYKTVILPEYMETLDSPTAELLSQFIKNGGKVIVLGKKPSRIDGAAANYGNEWANVELLSNSAAAVAKAENEAIKFKDINPGDGRFFHMRRQLEDGQVLFFANSSIGKKAGASLSMKGQSVLLMDAMEGTIKNYPFTDNNGEVSFSFELEPSGSILFFVSDKEEKMDENTPVYISSSIIEAKSPMRVKATAPNVMAINYPALTFDGKTLSEHSVTALSEALFKARGFEKGSPWNMTVQFKQNTLDRNKEYTDGSGFKVDYKFTVAESFDYSGFKATLELPYTATITINGDTVTAIPDEYFIDRDFKVFAIGQSVKEGENTLTIDAPRMDVFAEIEAAYITGDFTLQPTEEGFTMHKPSPLALGSWKKQGWPFYNDNVIYSAEYEVTPTDAADCVVQLNEWNGTVAEVIVNGESAGIIGWAPYSLNVSKLIKEGRNTVEVKVIGSNRNLLGPFSKPTGYTGPWEWIGQPVMRAGTDYFLFDYGLFAPFTLCKQNFQH